MRSRAAAKGRKLLFLAAVCLLPALLLSPIAEASRGLPPNSVTLEPPISHLAAEAPPAPQLALFHPEDELLVELLTGVEPEYHQALLEHRRLELLTASAIQKTASGVSTSDLELNVQKGKPLKPDLRWTVPFYAKARFYDPEVGRFLSEDPAEPDLTTPPSLHRYLYAYGNPTRYWDPYGLSNDEVVYKWDAKDDIPLGVPYYTVVSGKTTSYYHADPDVWRERYGDLDDFELMLKMASGDPQVREGGLLWKALNKTSALDRVNDVKSKTAKLQLVYESSAEARTRRTSVADEDIKNRTTSGGTLGVAAVGDAAVELVAAGAGFAVYAADNLSILTGAAGLSKAAIKAGIRGGSRYFIRNSKDEILEVAVSSKGKIFTRSVDEATDRALRNETLPDAATYVDDGLRAARNKPQPFPWRDLDEGAPDPELFDRVLDYRVNNNLLTRQGMKRNVAVAKVRIDGKIEFKPMPNVGQGGPHSEEMIAAWISDLRSQGNNVDVLELLTERTPCFESGGCRSMIAEYMPGVRVFSLTRNTGARAMGDLSRVYGLQ